MTKKNLFEELKDNYLQINNCITLVPKEEMAIDFNDDLGKKYDKYISKLQDAISFMQKSIEANDKVATIAALVHIRVCSIRLSDFFLDFKDDAELFLKKNDWPDIPDNYSIPEHYNFPHK